VSAIDDDTPEPWRGTWRRGRGPVCARVVLVPPNLYIHIHTYIGTAHTHSKRSRRKTLLGLTRVNPKIKKLQQQQDTWKKNSQCMRT